MNQSNAKTIDSLPSAETGDWSDSMIVMVISKAEVPRPSDRVMGICIDDSTPSNLSLLNSTVSGPNNTYVANKLLHACKY